MADTVASGNGAGSAANGATSLGFFTVPNVITLVRLCCIPLFLWLLFGRDNRIAAAWLLGGLGATDWVDGFIARRYGQVSEIGKVLDPTADRLLFIVGITAIIVDGSAPLWVCLMVLIREVLIGGSLAILTLMGMKRFDVTWYGKAGTFALMFAFPGFMLGASEMAGHRGFQVASWIITIPGLVFSYLSAVQYIPKMRIALREGRAERERNLQEG